jgi:hypothetical protein
MLRLLVGGLVGGLILFFWQFLSWNMLNVHGENLQYTPHQQEVLDCLSAHLEDGEYMIPAKPPEMSQAEFHEMGEQFIGKPWASINYHKSFAVDMPMNLARGFTADFLAAFLLCWVLLKIPHISYLNVVLCCLAVGMINYLTGPYISHVWFETSSIGSLVDNLVSWGVIGLFWGWWLRR